jgi:hypothetical protein
MAVFLDHSLVAMSSPEPNLMKGASCRKDVAVWSASPPRTVRRRVLLEVCCLLATTVLVASADSAPRFRGVSYTPWGADILNTDASDESIANIAQLGIDTVALNVFWFQDDLRSTSLTWPAKKTWRC